MRPFQFRPILESLDGRVMPDATPTDPPPPVPSDTFDPGTTTPPPAPNDSGDSGVGYGVGSSSSSGSDGTDYGSGSGSGTGSGSGSDSGSSLAPVPPPRMSDYNAVLAQLNTEVLDMYSKLTTASDDASALRKLQSIDNSLQMDLAAELAKPAGQANANVIKGLQDAIGAN